MIQIQKNLTNVNYDKRGTKPSWIVVHYTGNNGDTAKDNTNYFKSVNRSASAHYFVDENSIWQCVEDLDSAWHVSAGNVWLNGARNNNSIAIEMCSRTTDINNLSKYYLLDKTVENTVELVKMLMEKYGIKKENVCRHFDVTGKYCPAPFVYNNGNITWNEFKTRIGEKDMTQADVEKLLTASIAPLKSRLDQIESKQNKRYKTIDSVPNYAKEAISFYIENGYLSGTSENNLDLTEDLLRNLVITYRVLKESKYGVTGN